MLELIVVSTLVVCPPHYDDRLNRDIQGLQRLINTGKVEGMRLRQEIQRYIDDAKMKRWRVDCKEEFKKEEW